MGISSEWQIVGSSVARRLLCWWEWSRGPVLCCRLLGSERRGSRNGLCCLATNNIVCTNLIEPAALPFVSINVKLYGNLFASLNAELLDAVFAEKAEDHLPRILPRYFKNVFLAHPRVACASRDTALGLHDGNYFSC